MKKLTIFEELYCLCLSNCVFCKLKTDFECPRVKCSINYNREDMNIEYTTNNRSDFIRLGILI